MLLAVLLVVLVVVKRGGVVGRETSESSARGPLPIELQKPGGSRRVSGSLTGRQDNGNYGWQ